MTIQQEAYEKIMKLPDDGVRLILPWLTKLPGRAAFFHAWMLNGQERKKHFRICWT